MKPYTLIIVPRWLYDKHRPNIEQTAAWQPYRKGQQEFAVCCVQTVEISTVGGAYNVEQLLSYTCGDNDNAIYWHPCDDYESALTHLFGLVPERVQVTPE